MKTPIKPLVLVLSLGLSAATLHATCGDSCDNPETWTPECDSDDDNNNGDSMPEGVVMDDMPTAIFADDVALPDAPSTPSGVAASETP